MASSSSAADASLGNELSAAQRLLQKHSTTSNHHVIVEDVPDEEDLKHPGASAAAPEEADAAAAAPAPSWAATPSAKAAGKQKAADAPPAAKIDTQSHELFPELGAPKKTGASVAPIWSAKNGAASANGKATNGTSSAVASNSVSGASTPASSRAGTPAGPVPVTAFNGPPSLSIPGRNVVSVILEDQQILPRGALKRPIADIIKDINRKSRANITMLPPSGGRRRFEAAGPSDVAQQALKDLVQQIGAKVTSKVPIPQSVRPHIIGKQGSTIKALQEKTGARIQLPRAEDVPHGAAEDDDDAMIDVIVEGNALSARAAQDAILKIAGERTANVNTRLRGIPAEFYPFISSNLANLEDSGVQVRVPPMQPWSAQPPHIPTPGARPIFAPTADNHIQLAGERLAVQNARAEIEKLAQQLHERLDLQQTSIPKGRQQFIIGNHGTPMEEFFNETGCTIVLPTDEADDVVTVIGPADRVEAALERAIDLAMGMQCSNYDISRVHRQTSGSAAAHARNVTRYLRQRKEIDRLEKEYQSRINTPFTSEGALPWELYSRDGKKALKAQSEIKNIVASHPPARMATVPVNPFYYNYLQDDVRLQLQQDHGVYLVVPEATAEPGAPVLLVFEGPDSSSTDSPYTVPQTVPSPADVKLFQEKVLEAQKRVLELIGQHDNIESITIDVPVKFHDKLKKFIKKEQESRPKPHIRVSNTGPAVTLRGPKALAEELAAKVNAFVEQAKEEEKERGFTLTFDFPKTYANHLIGKGGSHIRELRDKFDVEIQVQDGMVELKGPKAKAEAAKVHINAMARQLADEVTHIVKIEPKFHKELIGAQGSTINRLQTRYKVLIFFPRVAKPSRDDDSVTDVASDTGKGRRQQAADEVIIRGPKKGADEAREEIMTLYLYLKENSHTATVSVEQKSVPLLIGQGGSAMDDLRRETGAKIEVPNNRGDPTSIVDIQIKGTKAQVAAAKKALEAKIAILDDTIVKTIEVDKKYHKALIGSGGSNIREIILKAGGFDDRKSMARTIHFPSQDSSDNTIKIEGRTAIVESIYKQIQDIVAQRENQVVEVLDIPQEKHRLLIGRGGETRRQLESKFAITFDIPRQGEGKTEIKITGEPAHVEKAKAHILSLVKDQHSETVPVARSLHHAVAANGQFFRRMRSDHKVTIDHAGQVPPARPTEAASKAGGNGGALPLITDDEEAASSAHSWRVLENRSTEEGEIPWVLHGTPENVEAAKKALLSALEKAGRSSHTGLLVLPDPSTYRHVVGQGGRRIDAIRKQSGCRINVPHGRSGGEPIEIVGSEDGVEKAKELILAAVQEGVRTPRE